MQNIAVILEARTQSNLKIKFLKSWANITCQSFDKQVKKLKCNIIVATSKNKKDIRIEKFYKKK